MDILRLRDLGYSYNKIVEELGCSKSVVCYYLGADQSSKRATRQIQARKILDEYINGIKSTTPCADCGKTYPYYIMDFDHIGDDKSFDVSRHTKHTRSIEIIKQEIAKCEVVCSNCHRARTFQRLKDGRNSKSTGDPDQSFVSGRGGMETLG